VQRLGAHSYDLKRHLENPREEEKCLMSEGSHRHSQYVYAASAYGFAAELERPAKHSIPTQAGSVLAASGGRGCARTSNFKFDGVISVADAYSEVGGSYDDNHDLFTTYAFSVLEGVNIADVFTADRVVARLTIYTHLKPEKGEPRFDITGSHFENVKIAGHKVDVKLATDKFHKLQKYSQVGPGKTDEWLAWSKLGELTEAELEELKHDYHGLPEMAALVRASKEAGPPPAADGASYLLSPANHFQLKDKCEIRAYGNAIFVPKFGVIRLAELLVHKNCRFLTMFQVQMCSGSTGGSSGGGAGGSGGTGTTGG
jgi:hypothetical protein